MGWNSKIHDTKDTDNVKYQSIWIPPPPPKEVQKIRLMLSQAMEWASFGDQELTQKHWQLIADECQKIADENKNK